MKLLCITHGPAFAPSTNGHWQIEFGETYEGIGVYMCPIWGKYYFLRHDPKYAYAAEHFVELPDDEELVEQMSEADRLLQACADMMPEVEMEPGAFERVWANVKSTL